jgi:flagellar motor switch protein FliM
MPRSARPDARRSALVDGALARAYDFGRPAPVDGDRLGPLQRAVERAVGAWSVQLTHQWRVPVAVAVAGVETTTLAAAYQGVAPTSPVALIRAEGLLVHGFLELPAPFVLAGIDRLAGGQQTAQTIDRALTMIELRVLEAQLAPLVPTLTEALSEVAPVELGLGPVRRDVDGLDEGVGSVVVLVAALLVLVDGIEGTAHLALPLAALGLSGAAMVEAQADIRIHSAAALRRRLADVHLTASVRFTPTRISAAALVGLQIGDVLRLDHLVGEPLAVVASDHVFGHVVPGADGEQLACRVVDPLAPIPALQETS